MNGNAAIQRQPRPGWITRTYPEVLERWAMLTDAARLAAVVLYGSGCEPGDVVEVIHRQFHRRIGRRNERSSRRAFENLVDAGVVARVFMRRGCKGRTLYKLEDPVEAYQRHGAKLAEPRPDQLVFDFAEAEPVEIVPGVLRLFSGGENAAQAPLSPGENAAQAPHLSTGPGCPKKESAENSGGASGGGRVTTDTNGAKDPGTDRRATESNTGQGIEAVSRAVFRGDQSGGWAVGGSGREGPTPPPPADSVRPVRAGQGEFGARRASRVRANPNTKQGDIYLPKNQTQTQSGSGNTLGAALAAFTDAGGGDVVAGMVATADEARAVQISLLRSRLEAAVRRAERHRRIDSQHPDAMRGSWPVEQLAAAVVDQQIEPQYVDELVAYLDAGKADKPGAIVVSRLKQLQHPRRRPR